MLLANELDQGDLVEGVYVVHRTAETAQELDEAQLASRGSV